MLEVQVLQAVVEDQGVRAELLDRVAPGFHAILVHDHEHAGQILREHVWLVARFA